MNAVKYVVVVLSIKVSNSIKIQDYNILKIRARIHLIYGYTKHAWRILPLRWNNLRGIGITGDLKE